MPHPEGTGPQLSRAEKRELLRLQRAKQYQRKMTRNSFIKIGVGVGALAITTVGGIAYGRYQYDKAAEAVADAAVAQARESDTQGFKITEAIIGQADKGFTTLSQRLQGKLNNYSPVDQQALLAPIQLYDANRANPVRNTYTLRLQDLNARGEAALETAGTSTLQAPNYFFMEDLSQGGDFLGAFDPGARSLNLSPQLRGDNLYDMLIAYHETEHARQDMVRRSNFIRSGMWSQYWALIDPNNHIIVGRDEQEAYLKESLVFDALTDGRLRKDISTGTLDIDWYVGLINARTEQKGLVESEIEIARQVFTSGSDLHNFTPRYTHFVNSMYRNRGGRVVDLTPDLNIVTAN